ncbi:SUN domain-containing protein 2 isoform X1 [Silurus meridionalis]|uniref:SUN domain-containing protein 2 isoform X1 n=1 Tax=Silurus meridionalis TaxID=175797 RepID=UPI001EE9EB58|nr:SUN domain-containing protein 2 isoform X1 [Silurus meridionalis]
MKEGAIRNDTFRPAEKGVTPRSRTRESRRSARLVTSRYHPHDDDTASTSSTGSQGQISYRESTVRVFKRKLAGRKGGGASPGAHRDGEVSRSHTPSKSGLLLVPPVRKSSAFRAPGNIMTPLIQSAPSSLTLMDPSGFSSGYSSSEEGQGRSPSMHNTTPASAQPPSEGAPGPCDALTASARAFALVYFWLGTAWYSITSGMSLLDVSLLSRCTAGMRKNLLLLLLLVLLLFGVWYWYPCILALFPGSVRSPPVKPQHTTHTQVQPRTQSQESEVYASLAALKDELYTDLLERETKRFEGRDHHLENVLNEIKLLKQDGEKQKRSYEILQMDVQELKTRVRNVDSEHRHLIKEETLGMENQISDLKLDLSNLQSASERLGRRLDAQESQNAKLKAELSDWLLQQLSGSVSTERDVVMRPELQRALEDLEKKVLDRLGQERENTERSDVWRTVGETLKEEGVGAVSIMDVERIVQRALSLHRADGIGMADYALESSGASVVNTRCSETYHTRSACISLFGFPLWYPSESPRTVIQPELYPGKCWPFRGSEGFLVIALSHPVQITHVSLEHLPRVLSPTGHIDSAPKDFAVYGMTNEENVDGTLLGTFVYDQDAESIQTFAVQNFQSDAFELVELRILSNWGHPEYTCVYRFRVHGQPASA